MSTAAEATEAARFLNDYDFPDHGILKVDIVDPNRHYVKKRGGRRGGGRGILSFTTMSTKSDYLTYFCGIGIVFRAFFRLL